MQATKRVKLYHDPAYVRSMGFLTRGDIKTIIDGYFADRIKGDSKKKKPHYYNLATLAWALDRLPGLMFTDEDGWKSAAGSFHFALEDGAAIHRSNVIRLLHGRQHNPSWLVRFIKSESDPADLSSKIHSEFYNLPAVEDAIPETKSTVAPSTFKCSDCFKTVSMKREKQCVPVDIVRFVSSKWHGNPDKMVGALCTACYCGYIGENGELLVPSSNECGLCGRSDHKLHTLRKPEPSILDLDVDTDIATEHYSDDELEWLRGTEKRRHDFWCPVCITHTAGIIGEDTLKELRNSLVEEWFNSDFDSHSL